MISLSKKSRDLSFLSWCLWLFYNAYFILSQTSYLTVSEYASATKMLKIDSLTTS